MPLPFSAGESFIVTGTAETRSSFGSPPCPVWVDATGVIYHLFQTDSVSNADFDRITTTDVTSRLKVTVRRDLRVGCETNGTTVEVNEVLQIITP